MSMFNASDKAPGLDAIQAKYGADMVQRFQNWPQLQKHWLFAQGWKDEEDPLHVKVMDEIRQKVERAKRDKDYALEQAGMIVRSGIPRSEWAIVPSVAQLRREWGFAD